MDEQLASLLDTSRLLDESRRALLEEPNPVYAKVLHAREYIDKQIEAELAGEPVPPFDAVNNW